MSDYAIKRFQQGFQVFSGLKESGKYSFIDIGIVGKPIAKERPRFNSTTRIVYTPKTTKVYEKSLAMLVSNQIKSNNIIVNIDSQIYVNIDFLIKDIKKGDLDNFVKAFSDSMNGVLYKDDKQIYHIDAAKYENINEGINAIIYYKKE